MMITVTRSLEDAIKKVPDLKVLQSANSRGSYEISAFLNWDVDINMNQQMLQARIDEIKFELPPDMQFFAISTRLKPKLMTALGAIIALLPLAVGVGTGAQMHQPLAIAVIGGFIIALPLLLIIFPTILHLVYVKDDKKKTGEIIAQV